MSLPKQLADGKAPTYLLHGDESFLTRQAFAWLRKKVMAGGLEDFNLDRFDCRDAIDVDAIVQGARTLPMMAETRLIWVRHAELLCNRSKEQLKALIAYVREPDPTTCLVLEATSKVKKNGALYKAIAKAGCVLESTAPRERDLPGWVRNRAKEMNRAIRPDAAALLVEVLGRDLSGLDDALNRLVLFVPSPGDIQCSHVEETVSFSRTRTVWELIDAIADRKVDLALDRSLHLLDQGEQPLQLLALVTRHVRQLMLGRGALAEGVSRGEVLKRAGVPPFREGTFMRQLDYYGPDELVAAVQRLAQADMMLKSSKLAAPIVFTAAILDICAPRDA